MNVTIGSAVAEGDVEAVVGVTEGIAYGATRTVQQYTKSVFVLNIDVQITVEGWTSAEGQCHLNILYLVTACAYHPGVTRSAYASVGYVPIDFVEAEGLPTFRLKTERQGHAYEKDPQHTSRVHNVIEKSRFVRHQVKGKPCDRSGRGSLWR
jgi:hypothetical protein